MKLNRMILTVLLLSSSLSAAPLTIAKHDVANQAVIEQAYAELVKACPTVRDGWGVDKIDAAYNHGSIDGDPATLWRADKYGWTEDVKFSVHDSNTETHHFYVATGNHHGVVVDAKQSSLDFCGINGNMQDHYLIQ